VVAEQKVRGDGHKACGGRAEGPRQQGTKPVVAEGRRSAATRHKACGGRGQKVRGDGHKACDGKAEGPRRNGMIVYPPVPQNTLPAAQNHEKKPTAPVMPAGRRLQ